MNKTELYRIKGILARCFIIILISAFFGILIPLNRCSYNKPIIDYNYTLALDNTCLITMNMPVEKGASMPLDLADDYLRTYTDELCQELGYKDWTVISSVKFKIEYNNKYHTNRSYFSFTVRFK